MKKFLLENKKVFYLLFLLFLTWRILLIIPLLIARNTFSRHPDYMGIIPWSNMDGLHYLSIAEHNYMTYEQAFFPLFPLTVHILAFLLDLTYISAGMILVHVCLLVALYFLWKIVLLNYDKKTALWTLMFLLSFPTSFFLGSVYTESMFLMLIFVSFYYLKKRHFVLSSVFGMLASATRFVGIFLFVCILYEMFIVLKEKKLSVQKNMNFFLPVLLVPLGLLIYMFYLWRTYGNPLLFVHVQSAFNTGRSGKSIVLLPQVIWRYIKILTTVSPSEFTFLIALFELITFFGVVILIIVAYKKQVRFSYILFSFFALFVPTLSGTFSSLPRYVLASFVIFIVLAKIKPVAVQYIVLCIFIILQLILTGFFLQGFFVS